jgi:hypothetical protein
VSKRIVDRDLDVSILIQEVGDRRALNTTIKRIGIVTDLRYDFISQDAGDAASMRRKAAVGQGTILAVQAIEIGGINRPIGQG